MKSVLAISLLFSSLTFAAAPDWVTQTHRQVLNGDIIHWGTGEAQTPEIAIFKARHMAIGLLIEECGGLANKDIIPRKQYTELGGAGYRAYALVSLDWDSCNNARDPGAMAHPELTENPQLKQGQILYKQLIGFNVDDPKKDLGDIEERIKQFLYQEADIRTDQMGILKEKINRLEQAVKHLEKPAPVIPIKLPSMTSQKAQCQLEYQNLMTNLTIQAANGNGNMAAPELSEQFWVVMQKKNICGRLE